jgi:capsule polysaccharide modification protein KpsS
MLCNLAVSYVDAINKGAVPNIESSWIYICKNECLKAQYDAYDKFERTFAENYELRAPLFDDELKEIYQEAKRAALDEFSKVAVGEVQR